MIFFSKSKVVFFKYVIYVICGVKKGEFLMINVTENIYNASFITTFWNNKVMDVVIPLNASNSFMTSCTGLVRNFVKILKINKFQFNLHPHDGLCLVHIFHCFRDEWCLEKHIHYQTIYKIAGCRWFITF